MKKTLGILLIMLLSIITQGCSGGGGGGVIPPSSAAVDMTGTWMGTWKSNTGVTGGVSTIITQQGSTLSGTGTATGTTAGTVSGSLTGSISGLNINFGIGFAVGGTFNYTGSVNAAGTTASGTYSSAIDSGTWTITKQATAANQTAEGFWLGTLKSNPINTIYSIIGLISSNGKVRFVNVNNGSQFVGTAGVVGSNFSAALLGMGPLGFTFLNGQPTTTINTSGSVTTKQIISGIYTAPSDSGSFSLTYNTLYDRPVSLSLLARAWTGVVNGGTATVNLTVDTTGLVTGTDNLGCSYAGTASIATPSKNMFNINLSSTICNVGTVTYTGLAVLSDTGGIQNNVLSFGLSSGTTSFVGQLM